MWKHCNTVAAALLGPSLALALALAPAGTALAAASKIEHFDAQSWQSLQKQLPRPAVVVFSTTDCSHCPAVIAALAARIKQRASAVPLVVVVMDGADQPGLLQEPHYRPADRLLVFQGQSAALQYSVNPGWRGITPYVALLAPDGSARLVLGKPSSQELDQWLGPR